MNEKCEVKKDIVMIKGGKPVKEEAEEIFDRNEMNPKNQESCVGSRTIDIDVKMSADDELKLRKLSTFSPPLPPDPSQKEDLPSDIGQTEIRSITTEMNGEEPIPTTEQLLPQKCQICGQDSMNNTRSMVRFLPTASAKSDISLHVFCGKIASILPQIAQPHLEILVTAGLKNKHGIGPYVNFALARTRSAVAVGGEAEKDPRRLDKQYYLVQEFEENLKSIRGLQLNRKGIVTSIPAQVRSASKPKVRKASKKTAAFKGGSSQQRKVKQHTKTPSRQAKSLNVASLQGAKSCTILHPSSTTPEDIGLTSSRHLSSLKKGGKMTTVHQARGLPSRIRCPCGGSYKGPARLKAHLKTPRHVLWESHNASARSNNMVDRNAAFNMSLGQQSTTHELEPNSMVDRNPAFNMPLRQQSSSRELEHSNAHESQHSSAHGLQQTNSLGLQQANSLRLRQTNPLELQQTNSLGLQQTNSLGLQQTNSLGLQQTNSLGLQQTNSLGLLQNNSLGLQQNNSLGLQQNDLLTLQQIIKNQGNINLAQLRTLLEQEGNRSLLRSHSGDNPSLNNITRTENNASQVNNMNEIRRQLAKAMLQGNNIGSRQGTTSLGANSQSMSPSLLLLLLLLSQKN